MTYELAIKLKEAGLGNETWPNVCVDYSGCGDLSMGKMICGWIEPTFEELVEACGEKLTALEQMTGESLEYDWVKEGGRWHAEYRPDMVEEECANGFTPQEAVAKLWLKLNKK